VERAVSLKPDHGFKKNVPFSLSFRHVTLGIDLHRSCTLARNRYSVKLPQSFRNIRKRLLGLKRRWTSTFEEVFALGNFSCDLCCNKTAISDARNIACVNVPLRWHLECQHRNVSIKKTTLRYSHLISKICANGHVQPSRLNCGLKPNFGRLNRASRIPHPASRMPNLKRLNI